MAEGNLKKEGIAVLDTAITKNAKFLVCILDLHTNKMFHNLYETREQMENNVHLFVHDTIKDIPAVTKIISDCSIAYLPRVINTIEIKGLQHIYNNPNKTKSFSFLIEPYIKKLIENN